MVPWAYVLDDLTDVLKKTRESGGLNPDPLSMREVSAMADYNLARSRNLFGGLQNAFDQRRANSRNVPMHMMPDYMMWLKTTQPDVYYHLYGPDPVPPIKQEAIVERVERKRDLRTLEERRRAPYSYIPPKETKAGAPPPPKAAPKPKAPPPPKPPPPKPATDTCKEVRDECKAMGKSGEACFRALSRKHHPDKGGSDEKMKKVNDCRGKV